MNLLKSHSHKPARVRTLLMALSLVAIGACLLVLLPVIRAALIAFGEMLLHRPLNAEHWQKKLVSMALEGLFVSVLLLSATSDIVSKRFEIIMEKLKPHYTAIEFGLIGIFAGAMILLAASNNAIWYDEACSLAFIRHSWSDLLAIVAIVAGDPHPPLFYLLLKCWSLVFGDSVFSMKFVSILPAVLTMFITGRFLKKEVSGTAAILFSLCCAASSSFVYYGIEIRMYSLALFFVTMTGLSAWHIIMNGKARYWAMFLLCALGAAYTHYYAAAACAIGFLLLFAYVCMYERRQIRAALCTALGAVLGYLPWLFVALRRFAAVSKGFWIGPLSSKTVANYALFVFNTGNNRLMTRIFLALFVAVFIFAFIRKNKTKIDFFVFCALSCLIILTAIGILVSLLTRPLIYDRYLFPACGLVWIFFAVECSYIKNRRVLAFICIALMAFSVFTFSATLSAERQEHKDFSRFYDYMSENIGADDMFIFPVNQSDHLNSISSYLFPDHVHIGRNYGRIFGSVTVSYDAFNADAYSGHSAWIIVMDNYNDGKPMDFTPDDGTELRGDFGWLGWFGYKFKLYYTKLPARVVDYFKNLSP